MAASEDVYFADLCAITVTPTSPSKTAQTIALGQDIELNLKSTEVYARGMGSELIQNRAKHSIQVDVKISFIKFLPTVTTWFPHFIADPTTGAGTLVDTCRCALFTVTGEFYPMTATNNNWLRTVTNVSFPEFPMKATYNQFIKVDLSGVGQTLVDSNPA